MRANLSFNGFSWLSRLDYKKLIIVAFLLRLIFASVYDIFVSVIGQDVLLPDGELYSVTGRYIALLLNGYDENTLTVNMLPDDQRGRDIFFGVLKNADGNLPSINNQNDFFSYIIGLIYFLFGFFPLGVRIFNISLSICSTYFLFIIAKCHFGNLTANLFLLIALFLPSQFGYSITFSKDFLRVFGVSLVLWIIYGRRKGLNV